MGYIYAGQEKNMATQIPIPQKKKRFKMLDKVKDFLRKQP